jgi:hypothetical protein
LTIDAAHESSAHYYLVTPSFQNHLLIFFLFCRKKNIDRQELYDGNDYSIAYRHNLVSLKKLFVFFSSMHYHDSRLPHTTTVIERRKPDTFCLSFVFTMFVDGALFLPNTRIPYVNIDNRENERDR